MLTTLLSDLRIFLTLTFLASLILLFDNLGVFSLPKSALQTITSPIQYGLYKTSNNIGKQFSFITLSRKASQENKALQEQLAQVLSENAELRRKLGEAEGFLGQVQTLDPQTYNLVATRPLGLSRFLILDKGLDDGIKLNQTVVYKDNFIGIIKEVSNKKSQVLLSSDPDSHIAAFAQNKNGKAKGVLNGQFGSEMILDKILHEEPIEKNDLIYSDGTEIDIPRGLILGTVEEVTQKDNEVFKQALIKPVVDVTNLDVVFVITN